MLRDTARVQHMDTGSYMIQVTFTDRFKLTDLGLALDLGFLTLDRNRDEVKFVQI